MRYGICSTCQSKHSIMWMKGDYYLHTHDHPGSTKTCEGSGQVAEAVIGDSETRRNLDEWDESAMDQDYWDRVEQDYWDSWLTGSLRGATGK